MKLVLFIFSFLVLQVDDEPARRIFEIKEDKIYYERVFEVKDIDQDLLYNQIKVWGTSAFISQKDALQADSKDLIIYKSEAIVNHTVTGVFGIKTDIPHKFLLLMKIYIKDEKVKAVITDINGYSYNPILKNMPDWIPYNIMTYIADQKIKKERQKKIAIEEAEKIFTSADLLFKDLFKKFETSLNNTESQF